MRSNKNCIPKTFQELKVQKQKGLSYKTYKNMLWSQKVYVITGKTKRTPTKYRVGKKWTIKSMLLKSAPVDKKSEEIIAKRTENSESRKKAAQIAKFKEIETRNEQLKTAKRPRRPASAKGRAKKLASERKGAELVLGPISE